MTNAHNHDPFSSPKANDLPLSLVEWRERVLDGALRGTFIVWAVISIMGVYNIARLNQWRDSLIAPAAAIGIYILAVGGMGILTFNRNLSFKLRANMVLFVVYILGAVTLMRSGFAGNGRLYLLVFAALSAILYDLRRSLWMLGISAVTVLGVHAAEHAGLWSFTPAPLTDIGFWFVGSAVFLLLGLVLVFSISFLMRSLDRSLADSWREQNFVSAILETSGALVALFDLDGRIIRFNRACENITGYTFAEVTGKYIWDLFLTPGGINLTKLVFDQIKEGSDPGAYECHWLSKTGERYLIAWSTTALRNQQGDIQYIVSTGIDITIHQKAEAERERLLAAEHEQRLIAETLTEITLELTSQTDPTAVLDEILRRVRRVVPFKTANIVLLEGSTLRSVRWQGYETFGGEDSIVNLLQPIHVLPIEEQAVQRRKAIIIQNARQDPRWISISGMDWIRSHMVVPIVLQNRVLGLLRLDDNMPGKFSNEDAKRLKPLANAAAIALENARLHQETLRQARRVQQILDSAHDGIVLLNADHHIELANPAAEKYLQSLAQIESGKPLTSLAGQSLAKLMEPPPSGMLWHELTIGREQRIFEAAAHPLQPGDESGGWVLVLREITAARKQQQYVQAQERLAMVGQLAAGIAHDFNNIMTVIILYAQMLLKLPDFASDGDPRMRVIFKQAKLAANLISQILDFSRQSVMERRPVNLVYFLKELLKMLKRTLPENIKLDLIYDEKEYGISADLTRLQQAVMNLAVNARDAMPDGGTLSMQLSTLELEPDAEPPLLDMEPGQWVTLTVSDTGDGIPPEDLNHVFEPFFTTKEPGKGTGLGLAQVYGIVKQHGGFIDLASVVGEGTTFTIYLPSFKLADALPPIAEEKQTEEGRGETILVVEDDENTLEAVCDILKTFNYRALPANSGMEALEVFERHRDKVALVISDMVMPGMSGAKLYTRLQEIDPSIKMVIITGYPFDEQDKAALSQGIVAWVQKPFVAEQIAAAIQEALPLASKSDGHGARNVA